MVVGRHLEYFSRFESYIYENITLHEWLRMKQNDKIF